MKFSLLYENTIWFFLYFCETWPYAWKQNIFNFLFLTKTRYFNTGFVSLQYKNTNQYWSKWSKKISENHRFFFKKKIFFWNNFEENFILFLLLFFRAGPSPAHVAGLDLASPAWSLAPASDQNPAIHARVMFYACMNSAKVIKLPSHCSSPSCRWQERKKKRCCNWWFQVLASLRLFVFLFFYILTCIIYITGNEKRSEHTWFWSGEGDGDAVFSASPCPLLPFGLLLFLLPLPFVLSFCSVPLYSACFSAVFSLYVSVFSLSVSSSLLLFSFPPRLLSVFSFFFSRSLLLCSPRVLSAPALPYSSSFSSLDLLTVSLLFFSLLLSLCFLSISFSLPPCSFGAEHPLAFIARGCNCFPLQGRNNGRRDISRGTWPLDHRLRCCSRFSASCTET